MPPGNVVLPLDEAAVRRELIPALAAGGYEAVAICLLSAYVAPAHETRLRELIAAALPGLRIACSARGGAASSANTSAPRPPRSRPMCSR